LWPLRLQSLEDTAVVVVELPALEASVHPEEDHHHLVQPSTNTSMKLFLLELPSSFLPVEMDLLPNKTRREPNTSTLRSLAESKADLVEATEVEAKEDQAKDMDLQLLLLKEDLHSDNPNQPSELLNLIWPKPEAPTLPHPVDTPEPSHQHPSQLHPEDMVLHPELLSAEVDLHLDHLDHLQSDLADLKSLNKLIPSTSLPRLEEVHPEDPLDTPREDTTKNCIARRMWYNLYSVDSHTHTINRMKSLFIMLVYIIFI
jgi:hypothetical protein